MRVSQSERERVLQDIRALLQRRAQHGYGPIMFMDLVHRMGHEDGSGNKNVQFYLGALQELGERMHHEREAPLVSLVIRSAAKHHRPVAAVWDTLRLYPEQYDLTNKPVAWAMALADVYRRWHVPESFEND